MMFSAIGCNGTINSTFVFCRSLRIYRCPSTAIWICLYSKFYISEIAGPVKHEKTNICRASSASLSFILIVISFITSLFCRKRIFFSAFSYLTFSKGLQRIILLLTARNISLLNQQRLLLIVDDFSPRFLRKKRYSSIKSSVMVDMGISCTSLLSTKSQRFLSE